MFPMKDILKQLRESKNYSQAEMGAIVGLSKSAISMYERGERTPDNEMLTKYANHFGVDYNFLHGYKIDSYEEPLEQERKLKIALFGDKGEVTDEMWEKVLSYANFLKLEQENKSTKKD